MFLALPSRGKSGSRMTSEKAKREAANIAVEVNIRLCPGSIYGNSVHEMVPSTTQRAIGKCGVIWSVVYFALEKSRGSYV